MISPKAIHALKKFSGVEGARLQQMIAKLEGSLFKQQIDFVRDPSKAKGALCTRRAGKTTMVPRYLFITALENPGSISRYWAISRIRAKELVWEELKRVGRSLGFSIKDYFNETELTIRLPNESEIRIRGADKEKEIHKKRGDGTIVELIDEVQAFGPYLNVLIDDVIGPSLLDHDGALCLLGTPGVVCSGYWYRVSARNCPDRDRIGNFSMHRWSVLDNPFIKDSAGKLAKLKKSRGWDDTHPTWLREYCGEWVNDTGALFYKFNKDKNVHRRSFKELTGDGWRHSLGWDVGFDDEMALVVWAWHPDDPNLYEAFSWKQGGIIVDDVIAKIEEIEPDLNLMEEVMDTGGVGKVLQEEARVRFHRNFTAAKKTEKYEHSKLFSDDLTAGRVFLMEDSPLAEEMAVLPVDTDVPPGKPPREDPRYANHCCDAAVYSWRACKHWLHEPAVLGPAPGTDEWNQQVEDELLEREEELWEENQPAEEDLFY